MTTQPLHFSQLYKACDIEQFHFKTTEELEDIEVIPGQERAIQSIQFGIRIAQKGYNLFALAPSGRLTGVISIILNKRLNPNC
jgi:hypothetical protein